MQTISVSKCKIAPPNKLLTLLKLLLLPLLLGLLKKWHYLYVCVLLWFGRFRIGLGRFLELEQDGRGWDGLYLVHNLQTN